jgi:hypothetical protein
LTKFCPIEVHYVEGVKDDAVGMPTHGGIECVEVRCAVAVLRDGLTINDG